MELSLGSSRDWADIEAMVDAGAAIDPDYAERHLVEFRGAPMCPRTARLRRLVER